MFGECCRKYQEMVEMGCLVFPSDVCTDLSNGKWIPREELETCKFLNFPCEYLCLLMSVCKSWLMIEHFLFIQNVSTNSIVSLWVAILKSHGFFTESYWYWLGVGAQIGFLIDFNICYTMALTYLDREHLYFLCFELIRIGSSLLKFVQILQHMISLKLL